MSISAKQIDALLPQTQCTLCGYHGCMPYAEALAKNQASINLCPPGGTNGLIALAELLQQDPTPFIEEMNQKAKPKMKAIIREAECIGCTKCIQACPVDAILGMSKQMHTVIADECTGCELCVAPCPVDCIDMVVLADQEIAEPTKQVARLRFQAREQRLLAEKNKRNMSKRIKEIDPTLLGERKSYLQDAVMRAKMRKK
jgi:electron transport complex protein RnfB